jgi:hypothetical protein
VPSKSRQSTLASGTWNLPEYHAGQQAVFDEMARRGFDGKFYLCAHRGWFKSTFAVSLVIEMLLGQLPQVPKNPKTGKPLTYGLDAGWYAPTMAPIRDNHLLYKRVVGKDRWESMYHSTDQIFYLPGGGQVDFYSLDEMSNAAGPTKPIIVVEEAGTVADGARDSILDAIYRKAKAAYGWAFYLEIGTVNRDGNPKNDFWKRLMRARNRPGQKSWVIPAGATVNEDAKLVPAASPYANPIYSFAFLQEDYGDAERKKRWMIEWLCAFISDDGGQFSGVEECCLLPCVPTQPHPNGWYQTGIDVGISNDYTVVATIDRTTNRMVYFRRFLPGKWEPVYQEIAKVALTYGGQIYFDKTGLGHHIGEEMGKRGVTLTGIAFNATNKQTLLDHLSSLVENTQVQFWNDPEIAYELNLMQRTPRQTGGFKIAAPKDEHDDIPVALALMCHQVAPLVQPVAIPLDLDSLMGSPSIFSKEVTEVW